MNTTNPTRTTPARWMIAHCVQDIDGSPLVYERLPETPANRADLEKGVRRHGGWIVRYQEAQ